MAKKVLCCFCMLALRCSCWCYYEKKNFGFGWC